MSPASSPAPDVVVLSVSRSAGNTFSKPVTDEIVLLEGLGVEGDAHLGVTVQHRFDKRADPNRPNLRQVHLIQSELFDAVGADGFDVAPGQLGENVTTRGLDILALSEGTVLHLGPDAAVQVTGLRTPCSQINGLRKGLLKEVVQRDENGDIVRRVGVMSIVIRSGTVRAGDGIRVEAPTVHIPLGPV
jgi:MOSC domain-containing protein YiiM